MFKLTSAFRAILLSALSCSGMAHPARVQGQELASLPLRDEVLRREFPSRPLYLEVVRRESVSHGLPPAVADAVVRIESGYNPAAVGTVGEVGLMQVRPATAAMLGFKGTHAELADPATNIRYGVAYLAKAWRLAGGDLCRALMKYRAGHGEESMSPLSAEYCRRARTHLAAIGWSPGDNAEPLPDTVKAPIRSASTGKAEVEAGPKIISVRSSGALLAAHRARIAEAWNRISVAAKR